MTLLKLYADCFRRSGKALARSPWTLVLPMAYAVAFVMAAVLASPLGIVGGFAVMIVRDLLVASYLYVLAELVRGAPVRLKEMPRSIRPYFWPLISVLFVLWIATFLVGPLLKNHPNGEALSLVMTVLIYVLLNAVPETLYQKRIYGGLATITAGLGFLQQNWIEWFLPNLAFGAALWFGAPLVAALPYGWLLLPLAFGVLGHCFMVFRGFLFEILDATTPRARAMRYRAR